jgi:hypothetical protein
VQNAEGADTGAGSLSRCADVLDLPAGAERWPNADILHYFRKEQAKLVAFVSGLHKRLGAESSVSVLDEGALVLVADALTGGWSLRL